MSYSLLALFSSAFVSATLFPGGSELGLIYLARDAGYPGWLLVAVASAGNTLGGMSSWGLGRLLAWKVSAQQLAPARQRAIARLERRGSPLLLLSWLPILGDPLCVAAGWLRIHWLRALLFIAVGKTLRYLVLLWLAT